MELVKVNINHSIEDEFRDDECVVIEKTETRKGGRIIYYFLGIQ